MKEIKLYINKEEITFAVQNYKIIYGENYIKKYEIFNKIERYFNEKFDDNDYYNKIYIEGEPLNKSDFIFLKINSNFDLEDEVKIGSKTLFRKYLELKLQNIEYLEELNTLKIILESLNDNYVSNNLNIELEDKKLTFSFDTIDNKQLIKMLNINLIDDEGSKSFYDLNYHELILLQLKMIEDIIRLSDKTIILLVDCYLNEYLLNKILSINAKNSIILINTNLKHNAKNIDDFLLVNNYIIDLFDEVNIYHMINKINLYINDIKDFRKILINYIKGNDDSKIIELKKII